MLSKDNEKTNIGEIMIELIQVIQKVMKKRRKKNVKKTTLIRIKISSKDYYQILDYGPWIYNPEYKRN